jgi:hypothetical protein
MAEAKVRRIQRQDVLEPEAECKMQNGACIVYHSLVS